MKNRKTATKVKFRLKIDMEIQDDRLKPEKRLVTLHMYECMACRGIFFGDTERCGKIEQAPNYCPVCGRKIVAEYLNKYFSKRILKKSEKSEV